ncbi:hypothetical protein Tco_1416810 [Tanacetum coccineum]
MVEPEPMKKLSKKDQMMIDEELAFKLQPEEEQEEEEEERLAREKDQQLEEANIVSWDNVQAMIDANYQMAQQIQTEEQEKLSIEEKSKLFVQLLEARKKHFAAMIAQKKRNKPPTKAQKRNTMSAYLKNMVGYKQNKLKNKRFDDIQKLFDKAMKRVNTFIDMDTELVEGSKVRAEVEIAQESGSKRADQVWRNQQDYRVLDWKLYDSCGVHSLRKQNVHIHMFLEKRYSLTAPTITDMLNRKLQANHWNEIDMDQDSVHMVAASKVPMLKPGEYELWRMRMEQYIQMIDYSLWEVIENGNAPPITKVVEGVETTIAPTTAEEKAQRKLELKAGSTLLMGIPNEY